MLGPRVSTLSVVVVVLFILLLNFSDPDKRCNHGDF